MFPRYVFFHPDTPRQTITAARSTRGVCTLVSFANGAALIDDALVASIRDLEQAREQAELKIVSSNQPGAHVRLRGQGLKCLTGLVLNVTNQRVTVLLEILGRQQMVEVNHSMLELH